MQRTRRWVRIALGATFWVALLGWMWSLLAAKRPDDSSAARDLWRHLGSSPIEFTLRLPRSRWMAVGDTVYLERYDKPIGYVSALLDREGKALALGAASTSRVRLRLDDRRWPGLRTDATARLVIVPEMAGSWALRTLAPPEKLEVIREEVRRAWRLHRDEIVSRLTPVALDLWEEVQSFLEREFRPFLHRHREEIQRLLRRIETETDVESLSGLFEHDVWPIIRRHVQPVTDEIGREIWDRFPLWGLSWRVAYQSLPLTRNDHFERRWKRFVDEEVLPILESHAREFIGVTRDIARETLANPRVAAAAHDLVLRLAGDPEFHRLAGVFVREVFTENPAFRARFAQWWRSARVQSALKAVSDRIERTVRSIADVVLGSREKGITPGFARVLRAQILRKDTRRIVLRAGSPASPFLEEGAELEATVEAEVPR